MARRHHATPTLNTEEATSVTGLSKRPSLNVAQYISIVGVHTTSLAFTLLYLPRTPSLLDPDIGLLKPTYLSSSDKPQHPFLVALTANPLWTVISFCAGTSVLQAWWAGWVRTWFYEHSTFGSADSQKLAKAAFSNSRLKHFGRAWLSTVAASAVYFGFIVLFGASIKSKILETYSLSLLLAILTVFTPMYALVLPSSLSQSQGSSYLHMHRMVQLFAEFKPSTSIERMIVYPIVGALLGAWFGVLPIALDWDRPWQAWPLTPAFASMTGYVLASFLALTITTIAMAIEDDAARSNRPKTK